MFLTGWTFPHGFQPGSLLHAIVALGLVGVSVVLVFIGRTAHQWGAVTGRRLDRILAAWLFFEAALEFFLDLRPSRIGWENSLPLHLCDIAGLVAPLALWTSYRGFRNILYFVGLGLSTQAYLSPILRSGPSHLEFWIYWIGHGGVIAAAIYDVAVREYRPTFWDWIYSVLYFSIPYLMIVIPLDVTMHLNYGYLGNTDHAQRSLIVMFGTWPMRIPRLILAAWGLTGAMVLPWVRLADSKEIEEDTLAEVA